MINLILIILTLMTIVLLILGVITMNLKRQVKRIKQDDNLKQAIRKYEMRWGE